MSSLRRILSSRANGARSIGPVTAEGKRRSAQNATSHGLLAHQIVMQDESPEGFEAAMNNHLTRLQPADGMEFLMVEEMVASHWRLRRALAIETRLLENEAAAQQSSDSLDRLATAFDNLAARPIAREPRPPENKPPPKQSSASPDRPAKAFDNLAAKPPLGLSHRYQTRL